MKFSLPYILVSLTGLVVGVIVSSTLSKKDRAENIAIEAPEGNEVRRRERSSAVMETEGLPPAFTKFLASREGVIDGIDADLKPDALQLMLDLLAKNDPEAAARILSQTKSGDLGQGYLNLYVKISENWSKTEPAAAYEWILSQKGEIARDGYESSLAHIAANYVTTDPAKSLEILASITIREFHTLTQNEIANRWVEQDPIGAFEWLSVVSTDGTEAEDVNAYYLAMMRSYSKQEPQRAGELVMQLKSSALRGKLVQTVAANLLEEGGGFEEAFGWVKSLEDTGSRELGLRVLAEHQEHHQIPELVDYMVGEKNLSRNGQLLLASTLGVLARSDRENAISLLERIPQEVGFAASEAITVGSLASDEAATIQWVGTLEPGPHLDGASRALAIRSMETDLNDALRWTKNIGDSAQRSLLVREIARYTDAEGLSILSDALPTMNLLPEQKAIATQIISERLTQP